MTWKGSVYPRGRKLWLRVKVNGKWKGAPTKYLVGEEAKAEQFLALVRAQLLAGDASAIEGGPMTVARWKKRWLADRRKYVVDVEHDETRLRRHILPVIGDMPIDEVQPRHVREIITRCRDGALAPRTIRNVYSVVAALFRDAHVEGLISANPCILRGHHLPKVEDKHKDWRRGAIYTAPELEALVSDPRIPQDRRVMYALEGLGMMRHGEGAGLTWGRWDARVKPLGRLILATSYATGRTKTGPERWMPVHPRLAAVLAAWRLSGWARTFGKTPGPRDLIVPRAPGSARVKVGKMRSKEHTRHFFVQDLALLGFRHRRGHDLRRTGISLAREGGADKEILRLCTHAPPRDVIDLYTTLGWGTLCAQVAALSLAPARARRAR